ncbi:SusC/RagA family TonB-linked outer membrane protein [Flavihumibacter solisilvae]|uniref:SusC/RagA family TonB-linked outer membrane protein n=1 Tax=Flavihumibacter solisilvae TaxID=1349421 RepID=UPI00068922CA|nr:SusC/RagA family TonB-linked outer membrane protein [Flavihumibacter solisilvae]
MFKCTVFLLLAGCLQLSANSFGQQITLSKKQASLAELFMDIHKQTGYYFYYNDAILQKAKRVDIDVRQATLVAVLDHCFRNQPLQYEIDKEVIIVTDKRSFKLPTDTTYRVQGKIQNEMEDPLSNVTVKAHPGGMMVMTDERGLFLLPRVGRQIFLEISCVGYASQHLGVTDDKPILITLRKVDNKLDEVHVIAYGTGTRRYNTGNVGRVKSEEISNQPVANPLAAMQGRVAGVSIQQVTGVPGGGFNIQLRGQNSLRRAGNELLYIVDGVPYPGSTIASSFTSLVVAGGNPLSALNPADIESIEVLKDADATAIYGSRGSNGVVLITTKKGMAGKTRVDFNGYTGWGKVAGKMDLLGTKDYLAMRREAFSNDGANPQFYDYDLLNWDTTRYTDWQKELVGGTANITNLELGLSGGNQQTQFLLNGTYRHETTVFPGDFRDNKGAVHLSVNHQSTNKRFQAAITGSYVSDNNNLIYTDLMNKSLNLAPVAPSLYSVDGKLNWEGSTWINPLSETNKTYLGRTGNLLGNATLGYRLIPGLQVKANLGYSELRLKETNLQPSKSVDPAYPYAGYAAYSTSELKTWIVEPQANFRRSFNLLDLEWLVGLTFQETRRERLYMEGSGYTNDAVMVNPAAASSLAIREVLNSRYRYQAVFSRLQLHWAKKYLLNLTGRRDGSSRFGGGNQFGNFGAIGAGWIFSQEPWISGNNRRLSFGKIRASYGITGSDQIGEYGYLGLWNFAAYQYMSTPNLQPSNLENPDYHWETNRKLELGMELGFFRDRLYMTASYYRNRSGNQLVGYPLPVITGFTSVQYNLAATVQNSGWEFEWTSINIKRQKFSWTTSWNLSFPRTKLLEFPNLAGTSYARDYEVGRSMQVRRTLLDAGIDPVTGIYQFKDANKDGVISYPADLLVSRPMGVRTLAGLSNTISWKGFELDFLFQGAQQDAYTYMLYFGMPGSASNQPVSVMNRWRGPDRQGDVQRFSQDWSGAGYESFSNKQAYGADAIGDASYLRLKNLSFAYDFSASWIKKMHLQQLRLYCLGQNLLTWTNYTGVDPESLSFRNIPPLKVFTVGCKITL